MLDDEALIIIKTFRQKNVFLERLMIVKDKKSNSNYFS